MLQPSRTKFRKAHKGRIHGTATSGTSLNFGQYGLKALEPERVTARQIEAARRAMTRHMKRAGRVWIRVFPDVPVSKKPIEVRMGDQSLPVRGSLIRFTRPFNLTGHPAASVPCGFTADGLPVGIEFLGRPFAEPTLFKLGYAYEQGTHNRKSPPTTPQLRGEP